MTIFHCISDSDDTFNVPMWILSFADTILGTLSNRKWSFTEFKKKKRKEKREPPSSVKYFYTATFCSSADLPSSLRNHGNFKITLQELKTETKRSWKHFSLANWHAVFVFMSFNFNTDNLLSETLRQSGSCKSCLDTVEEGSWDFMGHPLPLNRWPGKPSFCMKAIQSERWGALGRKMTSPL